MGTACDSSTDPKPTNPLTPILRQMSFGDWDNYSTAVFGVRFVAAFSLPPFDGSECRYAATDGSFTCPTIVSLIGTSYTYKYFLIDASGAVMNNYREGATAGVRLVVDVFPNQSDAAVIHHHTQLELSGLRGVAARTVTGTTTEHDTTYLAQNNFIATDATTSVNMAFQPGTNAFPTSGTLLTDVIQTATSPVMGASVVPRQFVVTFTTIARATMTGSIGGQAALPCTIDLSRASAGISASCT